MSLAKIFDKIEEKEKRKHRVTDFIIYPCSAILYRDPYSFVYFDDDVIQHSLNHKNTTNLLGYCPFYTQFAINYLLESAKSYLIGCKYSKQNYKFSMDLWEKKKKKNAKKIPKKSASYYPIAKNSHFFIKLEGLGLFYFQMVYRRKKKKE